MTTAHANFNQNMKEHARIRIEQMKKKKHFISTGKNLQEQTTINLIYLHEAKLISSCCKSVNMDVYEYVVC